jgi:hypothetical protein
LPALSAYWEAYKCEICDAFPKISSWFIFWVKTKARAKGTGAVILVDSLTQHQTSEVGRENADACFIRNGFFFLQNVRFLSVQKHSFFRKTKKEKYPFLFVEKSL